MSAVRTGFRGMLAGIRVWYLRRFRGYVAAPRDLVGGRGTSWQQHSFEYFIECRCGQVLAITPSDYFVRSRTHLDGCTDWDHCDCPVTDARFVKICQQCGLGHWIEWAHA